MSFKDDVSYVVQFTRSQLQFTASFLIIKEYNQNARIELFKKNVSRIKSNIYQRQSQSINYFFYKRYRLLVCKMINKLQNIKR